MGLSLSADNESTKAKELRLGVTKFPHDDHAARGYESIVAAEIASTEQEEPVDGKTLLKAMEAMAARLAIPSRSQYG
ncbi:hypothetical protein PPTG_14888 [Phytophthora nicotianae INRA-310]|uniref:Uncharacterized protein n=1 Tax=Phytophthora nicotianae (strain INRA-310) TaxID=761204 RepID=W2PVX3_PHYN3|nr:hypothetical protein PPTG_14888 [Phytophthora nicotianae INRA-310]ETN04175.1 hypothetical protein PPTG_14888 [Phytophthora nicotianae INRA-310]